MILYECESEETHVTAGGIPWNNPTTIVQLLIVITNAEFSI